MFSYSLIKHVSLALCQQENMDAPSRSTKQAGCFSHAEKQDGQLYFTKISDTSCSDIIPDNKPQNRDFFPPLLSVVLVLWRMERMLRLVLLSVCVTAVTHGWTTLLSASSQPNLMLILEPATSGSNAFSLTGVKTDLSNSTTNAIN